MGGKRDDVFGISGVFRMFGVSGISESSLSR